MLKAIPSTLFHLTSKRYSSSIMSPPPAKMTKGDIHLVVATDWEEHPAEKFRFLDDRVRLLSGDVGYLKREAKGVVYWMSRDQVRCFVTCLLGLFVEKNI